MAASMLKVSDYNSPRASKGVVKLCGGWLRGCGVWWGGCRPLSQAVVGMAVVLAISFQVVKRWCISVRYSVAVIRWRRGRKWGEIWLNADRIRCARPGACKESTW